MAQNSVYLEIDASDLQDRIDVLQKALTERQFNNAMHGIFKRTGTRVKKILGDDIPQSYSVPRTEVRQAVGRASVVNSGLGVGCSIPVTGPRRHIGKGGQTRRGYTATGHRKGWNSLTSGHYDIKARIYRGRTSTLPRNVDTGYPPFRNIPSSLNGLTFSRVSKKRLPIKAVMGPAIPQMPMNRSQTDVQRDIRIYLEQRIEARIQALIANGK